MSQREKLIERFKKIPSDFTYEETVTLLGYFGYEECSNDGSKRSFVHAKSNHVICLHEPHPQKIMKRYALRDIKAVLEER